MATFVELQTRIKANVIDIKSDVDADVPKFINQAIRAIERRFNFRVMKTRTVQTATTSASHTLMAVPSDFKELRTRPYYVEFQGGTSIMDNLDNRDDVLAAFSENDLTDVGAPRVVLEGDPSDDDGTRNFEVFPFSDGASDWTDGEYRVVIPYWKYLPDLVNTGDSNWFTVNAEEYIEFEATSRAFFSHWNEERGAIWAQRAGIERVKAITAEKESIVGGLNTMSIRLDVEK